MGESNTVVSAYTLYWNLQQYLLSPIEMLMYLEKGLHQFSNDASSYKSSFDKSMHETHIRVQFKSIIL